MSDSSSERRPSSSGPRPKRPAAHSASSRKCHRCVDTPLHVHENEDELFYALEGEHVVQVGDEEFHVRPGGLVFAPRRVPHSQRRVVPGGGDCSFSHRRLGSTGSSVSSRRHTKLGLSGRKRTPPRRRSTGLPGSTSRSVPDHAGGGAAGSERVGGRSCDWLLGLFLALGLTLPGTGEAEQSPGGRIVFASDRNGAAELFSVA